MKSGGSDMGRRLSACDYGYRQDIVLQLAREPNLKDHILRLMFLLSAVIARVLEHADVF